MTPSKKGDPVAVEAGSRQVEISNPDKVLFPDIGMTKREMAEYYARIADTMLRHVRGRIVNMHRYPDGIEGKSFFHKDIPEGYPEWLPTTEVEKEGGTLRQLVLEDAATLVFIANLACITPHVWLCRADRRHHPDRLVLDLDPTAADLAPVVEGARRLREMLAEIGLVPYVMTTGSRGLHVVVPLDASVGFDDVRALARILADRLAEEDSERFTVEQRKAKRGDRVFVDTQRNAYAQTSVAPYALRARPGAPVAAPLDWDELDPGFDPQRITAATIFRRLGQKDDPWRGIDDAAASAAAARDALGG